MTDHKVVLISGASSGIGRATAELLASRGYRVFGTARNLDTVVPVQGVELLSLDVRDDASVAHGVETALSRAGRIDVLVIMPATPSSAPSRRRARARPRRSSTRTCSVSCAWCGPSFPRCAARAPARS